MSNLFYSPVSGLIWTASVPMDVFNPSKGFETIFIDIG